MQLNLTKAEKVDLTKDNNLTVVCLGAGWDVISGAGDDFDLDIFAIGLKADKTVTGISYFGDKTGLSGTELDKDNLTGEGDGDDETITVTLAGIEESCDQIVFGINIYQGEEKGQNFGKVKNAFVRLYDKVSGAELMKYDLSEDYGRNTAVITGKMYRHGEEWKFQALGEGLVGDINKAIAETPAILEKF